MTDTDCGNGFTICYMVNRERLDVRGLGERVAARRQDMRRSQKELAEKAGLSEAYINRIEGGLVRNPKIHDLQAVAEAIGVTLDSLLLVSEPFSRDEQAELEQLLRDPGARVEFAAVSRDMRVRNWSDADKEFVLKALRAARDLVNARSRGES